MNSNERENAFAELGHAPTCARCLLWSRRGEVACIKHAPTIGSDAWIDGGWRAISALEAAHVERTVGHTPECARCER